MLNEKLQQASEETSRKRLTTILVTAGVVLIVGLAVLSASLFQELSDLKIEQSNIGSQKDKSGSGKSVTEVTEIHKPASPAAEIATPVIPAIPVENIQPERPKEIQAPLTEDKSPSEAEMIEKTLPIKPIPPAEPNTETRKVFKEALKTFEQNIEPLIMMDSFVSWKPETQKDILFLKNSAISSFSAGEYDQAIKHLQKASSMADQAISEKKAAFDQALLAAQKAKNADDYVTAKPHIDRALRLEPDSLEANKLLAEIDKLPDILRHLNAANVAKTENNLKGEYTSLSEALKLDPSRVGLRDRTLFLAREIKEQSYARYISSGLAQIEKRKLVGAQNSLVAARRLYPKRDETTILAKKVADLQSDIKTEGFLRDADSAAKEDDWERSFELFGKAKKEQPNNQRAADGYTLAHSINTLRQQISKHLSAPHRLASKNVATDAAQLIRKANALSGNSVVLDKKSNALNNELASYSVMIPIKVVSDGQTRISVRGVGRVGVTKEKIIKLKPGTYTFEGARAGYKSKLIRVNIPPRINQFIIELVCDERI